MENTSGVSSMVMYEDESVDVRYGSGAALQLSPCGSEFLLGEVPDPAGHPLQPTKRVRQRTRFTISAYKEALMAALAFRNKYASRPYLPEELIPAALKQPFFSIDPHVNWPDWASCDAEFGPSGETVVRSEEGRAELMMSPSGEEFSVAFTCRVSQPHQQHLGQRGGDAGCSPDTQQYANKQSSCNETVALPHTEGRRRDESPEQMHQSTTVVQHHSCLAIAPPWCYPLSLARRHWTARLSKPADSAGAEGTRQFSRADESVNPSDMTAEDRRSLLCEALPLTCSSPHRHRWKVKDPFAKEEDSPTELVKVMWCQGVTYRILGGAVPVIEVSPGDGSVIRSNGVLNTYFTHHKPELQTAGVKEVTYHLKSLPPDVPGQVYSVRSIVSRASRILSCHNEARLSLKLSVTPSCLREDHMLSQAAVLRENSHAPVEPQGNDMETPECWSDLVAAELDKTKRFNFLLENISLLRNESPCVAAGPAGETPEPVGESSVAEALVRTSRAIEDIDALISAATLT
ncbi:uncharacterized protein C5orf34 homolog [Aulostomus maculatus]